MARGLVVKLTVGADAPERCVQALTVAATAAASGIAVSVWLTGEATWLAVPGHERDIELPHSPPVADLLAAIVTSGRLTVCTQCAARRDLTADDLLPDVRVAGAQSFVEEVVADEVQALIY